MPPPPKPPARGLVKSRSTQARAENDESIYRVAVDPLQPPAAPKIKTYNVQPTSPTGPGKPRSHADSTQVSDILNPIVGPRDAQIRAGIKPFDFAKSNAASVREQSQLNNLRKAAAAEQDRLSGGRPSFARSTSAPHRRPSPVPVAAPAADNGRNFLQENRLGAAAAPRQRLPTKEDDSLKYLNKRDYGQVPQYLLNRKVELAEAEEAAARAKEAALIPPGMRLLPEEERLETLSILTRNRVEVEKALQALPIRIETPSQIRRKDDLEKRLKEIENAFKIFSRPKVLVHL